MERTVAKREVHYVLPLIVAYGLATILAYLRDASIAAIFGATGQSDAYFIGTFIPILITTILISGSVVPAFLPAFTRHNNDRVTGSRVVSATVTVAVLSLAAMILVIFLGAKQVIHLLAPSWTGMQLQTATALLRISIPSALALGVSAILAAAGNAQHRYLVPPLTQAASNATAILFTVFLGHRLGIVAPAYGLLVGSVLQMLAQVYATVRIGLRLTPALSAPDGTLREIGIALMPMVLFSFLAQSVPLLERWLASNLPQGGLSQLSYAAKLALVPIAVITTASSLVSFVAMSHASTSEDLLALREALSRGARLLGYLLAMSTVALIALARPLVDITLRRGEFSPHDAAITASLLAIYALGIVPNGLSTLLTRSFQARGAYWIPLQTGILTTATYLGSGWVFFHHWGVLGLAAAFSFGQVMGATLLHVRQPPVLRSITWGTLRHAMAILLGACLAFCSVFAIGRGVVSAGLHGHAGSLALLVTGTVTMVAAAVIGARLFRITEGRFIEDWLRTLTLRPNQRRRSISEVRAGATQMHATIVVPECESARRR